MGKHQDVPKVSWILSALTYSAFILYLDYSASTYSQSVKFCFKRNLKMSSDEVEGFQVVVQALKHHGIEYMFGVVGIPIVEVAIAAQQVRRVLY